MENIKLLMEKYLEGLTSLDEEQKLRAYFQRENVPQEWKMYQPIFQYFTAERDAIAKAGRPKPAVNKVGIKRMVFRWGSIAAAACLLLFVGLRLFMNVGGTGLEVSQAYIDGSKYTDIELIRTETLKGLENLSQGSEDAYSSQIEALEIFIK
jgi:hypothetical protein